MTPRKSIYARINRMILVLMLPLAVLFYVSTYIAQHVVEREVTASAANRLDFLATQINGSVDQLFLYANTLMLDPSLLEFKDIHEIEGVIDTVDTRLNVYEKLKLQTLSSSWTNRLAAYSVRSQEVIATYALAQFDLEQLKRAYQQEWMYSVQTVPSLEKRFVRYTFFPYTAVDPFEKAELIVESSFPDTNLRTILDQYKSSGSGGAFLHHHSLGSIAGRSSDVEVERAFDKQTPIGPKGSFTLTLEDRTEYHVQFQFLKSLGWTLVDYVPVSDILAPIFAIRRLFYVMLGVLAAIAILSSALLYRNVQQPILELVRGVQRLKMGDFAARIDKQPENEFTLLFARFNEMADQIQELVEKVYLEKLRLREATLKQLQSQINPHFLYNSLSMMKSMIKLGDTEAAIAMVYHLGEYFRYTTRVEKASGSLRSELELIRNYLSIQQLRMDRISFEIDVPESMLEEEIPRLLIQPVVENAIEHGIEPKPGGGVIHITGKHVDSECWITVEDNGMGLDHEQLEQLRQQLELPLDAETGCGLWNVHRRLQLRYGAHSGVRLESGQNSGMSVTLQWKSDLAKE